MPLLLQVALLVGLVHAPSLLVLVFLGFVFGDSHVQHIHPLLTLFQRLREELEHPVDHHQVESELLVNLLQWACMYIEKT